MIAPCSWMPLADARRSSRVQAVPDEVRFAERLIGAPGQPLSAAPTSVVVDPSGTRIAATHADHLELLEPFGSKIIHFDQNCSAPHIDDDTLRVGTRMIHWDARPDRRLRPAGPFNVPGVEIASSMRGEIWTFAVQIFPAFAYEEFHVHVRTQGKRDATEEEPRWKLVLRGRGTAAIADNGRVGVAMQDGRVLIAGPSDPPARTPTVHAELQMEHEPYAISAVAGGFVVLCAEDHAEPGTPGGDWSTRLFRLTRPVQLRWTTHVVALDMQGQRKWHASVPFSVRQPAIEWDDAVAVVGEAVARIQDGRIVWSRPAKRPAFATATGGGLVIASSRYVDLVGDDGVVRHRFAFDPGIEATTPPAVSAAGWIAQGTSDGIYLLR